MLGNGGYDDYYSSNDQVFSLLEEDKALEGNPFDKSKVADNLWDTLESIDSKKTHKGFVLKLKQKLTFEKLHGDKEAGKMLEKLNQK